MNEIVITGSTGVVGRRAIREPVAAGRAAGALAARLEPPPARRDRLGAAAARRHRGLEPDRRMTTAERFARARPRLLRLAYSELGDLGEAEDVVQETWLRLEHSGPGGIESLDGWLTTVVARPARGRLRSARARGATSARSGSRASTRSATRGSYDAWSSAASSARVLTPSLR
jgi:hypothetical protein